MPPSDHDAPSLRAGAGRRAAGGGATATDGPVPLTELHETPEGTVRTTTSAPAGPSRGLLVLGHGAGGGADVVAPDLRAAVDGALEAGWSAVLLDQPWKVAGRRVAVAPARLDVAWTAVVAVLASRRGSTGGGPLVAGGRSAGARVACRTAAALDVDAVVALAFPLVPTTRAGAPGPSRAPELATSLPVLVVQGRRDRFGGPEDVRAVAGPRTTVVGVEGDHTLRGDGAAVTAAVRRFLDERASAPR
ncbi:alpha/beta family hydrolase [Pseudokineococcus lusitanus]|uniref:KANL3/Tex30 alpha/beta hydrolase-like domain-containing protein n=1 Tax=Pseudokineococcus lusitanus TaxID=763993 RepID=A0A3N1HTJ0_9ACTN|nr:alpha/beta family hydrolase [Pseudokineococcus lusitanus]ROP45716.1 hypothetical protein EDC03_0321 [Pseudokineococcus lusitanus]